MDQELPAVNNDISRVTTSVNFGNSNKGPSKMCIQVSSNDEHSSTKDCCELTLRVHEGLSSAHLRSLVQSLPSLLPVILPLIAKPGANQLSTNLFNFNKFTKLQTRVEHDASKRHLIKPGSPSTNTKSR